MKIVLKKERMSRALQRTLKRIESFIKNQMTIIIMVMFFAIIIMLLLSLYFYQNDNEWISNLCLSICSGLFASLMIYFITNYRNNKGHSAEKNLKLLNKIQSIIWEENWKIDYYFEEGTPYDDSDLCVFMNEIEEAGETIKDTVWEISNKYYCEAFGEDAIDNQFYDISDLKEAYRSIADLDEDEWFEEYNAVLRKYYDRFDEINKKILPVSVRLRKIVNDLNRKVL